MITQVSFTADADLKNKALKKAQEEGMSLKTLLLYSMEAFVEGKIRFGLVSLMEEPEVEEIKFRNKSIQEKAKKLALNSKF